MRRTPAIPPGVRIPATPVVGYLRAEDPAVAGCLRGLLEDYAGGAGLLVVDVFTEPPGAAGAVRPAFTRCLETVSHGTARGILVPTWAHLGPDGVPGAVLLRAARDAGAPPVHADQRSAAPGPAQHGDLR